MAGVVVLLAMVLSASIDTIEDSEHEMADLTDLSLLDLLEMEVTSATLGSQNVRTAPAVLSVITASQIRALGLRTLIDALRLIPSISILNGGNGKQEVTMRGGSNAAHVLVTIDGLALNSFYNGKFFSRFPLNNIERIEVIRGPGSALYGTNAFSGVVSLISKASSDSDFEVDFGVFGEGYLEGRMGYGGFGHIALRGTIGSWILSTFGFYHQTEGPRVPIEEDAVTGQDYALTPGETTWPYQSAMAQLSLARTGIFGFESKLSVDLTYARDQQGPYFGPSNTLVAEGEAASSIVGVKTDLELPVKNDWLLVAWSSFDVRQQTENVQDRPPGYFIDFDGNGRISDSEIFIAGRRRFREYGAYRTRAGVRVVFDRNLTGVINNARWLVGLEGEFAWLPKFDYSQNYRRDAYIGTFGNHDGLLLNQLNKDRLILAALSQLELSIFSNVGLTLGLRFDEYSDFGNTFNPRLALTWSPNTSLAFKILYGRAFRAPTFRDLYDQVTTLFNSSTLLGNEHLQPEIIQTLEMNFSWSISKSFSLETTIFFSEIDNLIDFDPTSNLGVSELTNFPGQRVLGMEGGLKFLFDDDNYFSANVSIMDRHQLGVALPGYESNPRLLILDRNLNDLPTLRVNASLVMKPWTNLQTGLSYSFTGDSRNNRRNRLESGAFRFERSAFHQLRANVTLTLIDPRLELISSFFLPIDEDLPIWRGLRSFSIRGPPAWAIVGVNLRL